MLPAWTILIFLGIGFMALVIFLFRRNQKDRRRFEQELNRNYKKPEKHSEEESDDNSS
jgi:cbb3-type cytochrome oxidase subunit 3